MMQFCDSKTAFIASSSCDILRIIPVLATLPYFGVFDMFLSPYALNNLLNTTGMCYLSEKIPICRPHAS